jgi:hypothetical protein
MPETFKQLPMDGLLATWSARLPKETAEAYMQMGRYIAERDLNLAALFNELVENTIAGVIYLGDSTTDGSWRISVSGTTLLVQRRESSAWVTKWTFTA